MSFFFSIPSTGPSAGVPARSKLGTLPPAPLSPGPQAIVEAWKRARQLGSARKLLLDELQSNYPKRDIVITRSGTEALFRVFSLLRKHSAREFVLLSAYTCPDIAAAAVRAGFRLALLDVYPCSLFMNPLSGSVDFKTCAAVVLSNLYGLPEPIETWMGLAQENDFLLIDDACQAALSEDARGEVGARGASLGVLSFGRGKALAGVGGGALLLPRESPPGFSEELLLELKRMPSEPSLPIVEAVAETIQLTAHSIFSHPMAYTLPNAMPFLGLGKTVCDLDFPLRERSAVAILVAGAKLRERNRTREELRKGTEGWLSILSEKYTNLVSSASSQQFVLIRFPILLPSADMKRRLLSAAVQAGLGASGSYPSTLRAFPQLSHLAICGPLKESRKLAERILTLPVHHYVRGEDRSAILELLEQL